MAAGDVVNGIGVNATDLTFQPAAGVEVAITTVGAYNQFYKLTNGTTLSVLGYAQTVNMELYMKTGKILINNTNYLFIAAGTLDANGYTGIQIK